MSGRENMAASGQAHRADRLRSLGLRRGDAWADRLMVDGRHRPDSGLIVGCAGVAAGRLDYCDDADRAEFVGGFIDGALRALRDWEADR